MINFKSTPFFKILLPYILGVVFAFWFGVSPHCHIVFFGCFLCWLVSFILQSFLKPSNVYKAIYHVFTYLFLFVASFESVFLYSAKNNSNNYSHYVKTNSQQIMVCINDVPVSTEKFYKLPVSINCINTTNSWHHVSGNTIIYLRKDSVFKFEIGDRLLVNSKFTSITEPKNPYEFNYKEFLANRNIFHVLYSKPADVFLIKNSSNNYNLQEFGASIKQKMVYVFKNTKLSQPAFSICSALLVGYDDEIDGSIMQSFSHSGTLHILSVSGMHTAVLYSVLLFLFSLADKHNKYRTLRFYIVIACLFMFVLITGISPSVMRAALMLGFVLLGQTLHKHGNGYNTLLLSAFVLLLFNPFLLKDVGFLLSYLAVFGIMYLYPLLSKIYTFSNKILQWCWSGTLISISATLFTLPVSLYFFHQFPVWFVFSNLIIIPLSMLIMASAALLLLVYKVGFLCKILSYVINVATKCMIWLAALTDSETFGYIDYITFTKTDALFLSLSIILLMVVVYNRQYKAVLLFGFVLVAWLSVSIVNSYKQMHQTELTVFHVKQKSAYALRIGKILYTHFDDISEKEFQRNIKPYLLSISNLKVVKTTQDLKYDSSVICNSKHITLPLNNSLTQYIIVNHDNEIDFKANYKSNMVIIADCSNSYKFVRKLKRLCAQHRVAFYDVRENGAVQIKL